ncbi:MAG: hypothetical protein GY906_38025 [bacterium]|nr:hypothetical protein [bacterium]
MLSEDRRNDADADGGEGQEEVQVGQDRPLPGKRPYTPPGVKRFSLVQVVAGGSVGPVDGGFFSEEPPPPPT